MLSARGHIHPTFKLANDLKRNGHRVFFGVLPDVANVVVNAGFEYIEVNSMPFSNLKNEMVTRQKNMLQIFLFYALHKKSIYQEYNMVINDLVTKVDLLKPDVLFVDTFCCLVAPFLQRNSSSIYFLNVYIKSFRNAKVPPVNSGLIPRSAAWNFNLVIWLSWLNYFVRRYIRDRLIEKIAFAGYDNYTVVEKLLAIRGVSLKAVLDTNRFFYGIRNARELSLVPMSFDFTPSVIESPVNYNTSMVDLDRREVIDADYNLLKAKLLELKRDRGCSLIFCSLGTISGFHAANSTVFFERLIQATENTNWILVISTAKSQSLQSLLSLVQHRSNVYVSGYLPQLDLLSYTDAMVTHGGINSVLECISKMVPMLVYPLNAVYDQQGNAARVVFHRMGIRGDIKTDGASTIAAKLKLLLSDCSFRESIRAFNQKLCYDVRAADYFDTINPT